MKLTDNEKRMIENIITNNFGDIPDHTIWDWAWSEGQHREFCDRKQASGIISSLSKKGILLCASIGKEGTIGLTDQGRAFVKENFQHIPFIKKYNDAY